MEKKKVQIMNFNCTFGEMVDPLLSRFTDYFYPAITCINERPYRNSKYVLNDINLYEIDNRIVLSGILVESKEIVNRTKYDDEAKEVHNDNKKFQMQPVSYFGLFLDNHRMFYIKNQSESPNIDNFKATVSYSLREYRKMKNKERSKNSDAWDRAELNINAIPSSDAGNYAALLKNVKTISYLKFKLFTKNQTDIPGTFFDEILDSKVGIDSDNPVLNYPNPKNKEKIGELIAKSNGFAETYVKVEDNDGNKFTYINDDFQQLTEIELPITDDYRKKGIAIVKKMNKNQTLGKVSEFANTEYEKSKSGILMFYKGIIQHLRMED